MRLTVLGCTAPFPGAGRACPGYLVEAGDTRLLLDAGSGTLERLLRHCDYEQLTAVVVSHLHHDHAGDLQLLRYAIDAWQRLGRRQAVLPIYAPAEPAGQLALLTYRDATTAIAVCPQTVLTVGALRISFTAVEHSLPAHAVTIEANGVRLVYSGDSGLCRGLVEAAAGADLFLCEATFQDSEADLARATGHLTARQAATVAEEAGAVKLVLTHIPPYQDGRLLLAQARHGEVAVELAAEGKTYKVGQG